MRVAPGDAADRPAASVSPASIRHLLRTIASEKPAPDDRRWLARLQPLVARRRAALRHAVTVSGRLDDYRAGQARLADDVVTGLLHLMRVIVGMPADSMAPLLAVAVLGGGARTTIASGQGLDLLFLLPEPTAARAVGERIAAHVVAALWDLRFAVHYAIRTPGQCRDLARLDVGLYAELLDRRLLWGSIALDAVLTARLAECAGEAPTAPGVDRRTMLPGTPDESRDRPEQAVAQISQPHASDEISSFAGRAGTAYLKKA